MSQTRIPSEILLLSPRPETDPAFDDLARRMASVVGPVGVRVIHGDGTTDPVPEPGAALVTGGQTEALTVLGSISGEGWSWVHLTAAGPDHMDSWPQVPGSPLITHSRGINARSVAEWVLAAVLHFFRDFDKYARDSLEGRWERQWARELSGTTLVVVGAGAAGSEVALMAGALGMTVIGVSLESVPVPGFQEVLPPEQLDHVLPEGDVTVILIPLTPENEGSFGAEQVSAMKRGSVLLVASRGGIVDEEAVLESVRRGHLRGAAFDVFAEEPLPAGSSLWNEPGILVTPHVAGTTDRFMERTVEILIKIWKSAFEGEAGEGLEPYLYNRPGNNRV